MEASLTHWPLKDLDAILDMQFSHLVHWLVSSDLFMILPSDQCHRTWLMMSTLVQAMAWCCQINWANFDTVLYHHMASLGHNELTHWGRVTHICVCNLAIIGSDNGLSPGQHQAIIPTNAGIWLIGPLGTNFSEILIGIQAFSLKKIHLKMSSGKCWPFFSASMS